MISKAFFFFLHNVLTPSGTSENLMWLAPNMFLGSCNRHKGKVVFQRTEIQPPPLPTFHVISLTVTILNDNTQDHFASTVSDFTYLVFMCALWCWCILTLVLQMMQQERKGLWGQRVSALHATPSHHVWVAAAEAEAQRTLSNFFKVIS